MDSIEQYQKDRLKIWMRWLNMDFQGNYEQCKRKIRLFYEQLKQDSWQDDHPLSASPTVLINTEPLDN